MKWVKSFIERLCMYFKCNPPPEGENLFCVFLRKDSNYLFSKEASYKPLLFNTDILTSVEENECKVSDYLFENFGISPENVKIYTEVLSLKPLLDKTLSFAIVDLSEGEFSELQKSFHSITLPQITLSSDDNIFFNALTRLV